MKKLTFLAIIAALTILFTNCEEEETTKVDFNIVVTGESPNAIVQITNTSDSADIYTWEYSEGANMETSEEINPQLLVDKTGEFTITLTATIGKKEISKTKKVTITGINGISIFENVELGTMDYMQTIGTFFSCETGLIYKESEINNTIGALIDFVLFCNLDCYIIFYSPHRYIHPIPNACVNFFNYNNENIITNNDFDIMNDEQLLLNLNDANEHTLRFNFDEIPKTIFIKTEAGKWGAIKFKEVQTEKVIIDVKIQKYLSE